MPKKKEPTATTASKSSKKTTTKTATSAASKKVSAPAKVEIPQPVAPTPAKAEAPTKAAEKPVPAKTIAAEEPTEKSAPAKTIAAEKPAEKPAPAKTTKTSVVVPKKLSNVMATVIVAKYDVGFGNKLFIRGEGAGLSWDVGVEMKNVENDVWVWTTNDHKEGQIVCKFLINDDIWSDGENLFIPPGDTHTLFPKF